MDVHNLGEEHSTAQSVDILPVDSQLDKDMLQGNSENLVNVMIECHHAANQRMNSTQWLKVEAA